MMKLKKILGAALRDIPRYCWHLCIQRSAPNSWVKIKNRGDCLVTHGNELGVDIKQKWTSDLYLPSLFPFFGKLLFKKAFSLNQISFKDCPKPSGNIPDVSFIIGHRGSERTPLLLKTLSTIAAQSDCNIECIVVEQDNISQLESKLPKWVKHIFTPPATPDQPYSRAIAFNIGAQNANADCLIFHDNDLLISDNYAKQTLDKFKLGYDFINLKRFIFYLSETASKGLLQIDHLSSNIEIESIMQNAKGGGSIGASKAAFLSIGGFDERFVGWGGEDNELWERAETRKVWSYTYLPLIHLWHAAQTEKLDYEASDTKALYNKLSKIPPIDRIKTLKNLADDQRL